MQEANRKQLIKLLHSNEFEAVIKLSSEIIEKWNEDNVIGKDEFETLKLLFTREGKKEGLREFLNALENPE
jgi:DNA primase large subunit